MKKKFCSSCGKELNPDDSHQYEGDYFCNDCFNDNYNYCSRCDDVIHNDDTHWDDDYALCYSCWQERTDTNAPNNPDVDNEDRKQIIELCHTWLDNISQNNKKRITIRASDYRLTELRDAVGFIDRPVSVHGLRDRDEYQVTASQGLIDDVIEVLSDLNLNVTVEKIDEYNKIGISHSLRKDHFEQITELIKRLTTNLVPAIYPINN